LFLLNIFFCSNDDSTFVELIWFDLIWFEKLSSVLFSLPFSVCPLHFHSIHHQCRIFFFIWLSQWILGCSMFRSNDYLIGILSYLYKYFSLFFLIFILFFSNYFCLLLIGAAVALIGYVFVACLACLIFSARLKQLIKIPILNRSIKNKIK